MSSNIRGIAAVRDFNNMSDRLLAARNGRRTNLANEPREEDNNNNTQVPQDEQQNVRADAQDETNVNIKIETQKNDTVTVAQTKKKKKKPTVHPQESLIKYWKNFE